MIRNTKQTWTIGAQVKVGFMQGLTVVGSKDVFDGLPDLYLLERNGTYYEFIPHNGLSKLSASEAAQWLRGVA